MTITTILVEDSETIRANLIPTLEELTPVKVIAFAETQAQSLDLVARYGDAWDLIIVDLFLKEGSGLGIVRGCRDRKTHQTVLVLSNFATPEIKRQCLALGADGVFDKSTELDAFFARCSLIAAR